MDELTPNGFDHSNKEHLLQRELRLFETHFALKTQAPAPVPIKPSAQEQSNITSEMS